MAERLLRELAGEATGRREEALTRLRDEPDPGGLLDDLCAALGDDRNPERRNAARAALAELASPSARAPGEVLARLSEMLDDPGDADVQVLAAGALGESGNPAARPALERALGDPDPNVASAAADALAVLGDPRALQPLIRMAERGEFWTRAAAVVAIGTLGDRSGVPTLASAIREPGLTELAAAALGDIGAPEGLEPLRVAIGDDSARPAALEAAAAIYAANPELEVPAWLRESAAAAEGGNRRRLEESGDVTAARLLGIAGTPSAADALVRAAGISGEEPVAAGVGLLPPEVTATGVVARLESVDASACALLLRALPPLGAAAAARVAELLSANDEDVLLAAADALGRSPPEVVLPLVEKAVRRPETRLGAARVYARLRHPRCDPLEHLLHDDDAAVRGAAAEGLCRCGSAYAGALREAVGRESDPGARRSMVRALGIAGGAEAVGELSRLAEADDDPGTRFTAVDALGRTGSPDAFAPLLRALLDPLQEVQAAALHALGELGDARAGEALAEHLDAPDRDLRRTAAFALDRIAPEGAADRLLEALRDPDAEVRLIAVRLLTRIGGPRAVAALESSADSDPDPLVRRAAVHALDARRSEGSP